MDRKRLAYLRNQFQIRPYGSKLSNEERTELANLSLLEKEEDRNHFGPETFDWLVALLFKHDPIHLAIYNVPPDEYDNEARTILKEIEAFSGKPNLGQVLQIVYNTFVEAFNGEFDNQTAGKISDICYLLIAKEICENIDKCKK